MDPITVLIVDDHTVAREGLRVMLETDPQIRHVIAMGQKTSLRISLG